MYGCRDSAACGRERFRATPVPSLLSHLAAHADKTVSGLAAAAAPVGAPVGGLPS